MLDEEEEAADAEYFAQMEAIEQEWVARGINN